MFQFSGKQKSFYLSNRRSSLVLLVILFSGKSILAQSTDSTTAKNITEIIRQASELGHQKKFDSAQIYIAKAENIASEINMPDISAFVQNNKGKILYWQGNTKAAKELFKETLRTESLNDTTLAKAHVFMGEIYRYEHDFKKSIASYIKVEKAIRRTLPLRRIDSGYIFFAAACIGELYKQFDNKEKAIYYYKKAYRYCNEDFKSSLLLDISQILEEDAQIATALEFAHKAARQDEANNITLYLPSYYLQLSSLHKKLNNADSILFYAKKGLIDNEDCQLDLLYANLGSGYLLKNENQEAIKNYSIALEEATNGENELNIQEGLVTAFTKANQFELALQHNERYIFLKDSLQEQAVAEGITEITEKYEAEKKQVQIASLQKEYKLSSSLIDKQKSQLIWLRISLLLTSIIIFLALFYYWKQKKQKELLFTKNVILAKQLSENKMLTEIDQQNSTLSKQNETNGMDAGKKQELIDAIESLIDQHFYLAKEITLARMASEIDTNTTYLSRVINDTYKKSFAVFVNDLRIAHTLKHLEQSPEHRKLTIEHISEISGFASSSAFYTAFKKFTGLTPSYYIRKRLKQSS